MADKKQPKPPPKPQGQPQPQPTFLDSTWTWTDPTTYPLTIKFLPVLIAILATVLGVYNPSLVGNPRIADLNPFAHPQCVRDFNYTFDVARAKHYAETLAVQSWEIGTVTEAVLELINPDKAVFASAANGAKRGPFPRGKIPKAWVKMDEALVWLHTNVRVNDGPTLLWDAFSVSDPASIGVGAVLIGQHWYGWYQAAGRQKDFLLQQAPRYANGAISHRVEVAEVWADGVMMFPPFLAYYGVAEGNLSVVREAVGQVGLYRDVLVVREGRRRGLWRHVVGPSDKRDSGAWSTGNGWAAYGMLRVRATVAGWETSRGVMAKEIAALDSYVLEILDAVVRTDDDESGLLRNYLGDKQWWGEVSGTALLAASAYRMVMYMDESPERTKLLQWAHKKRRAVVAHVHDGLPSPVVNPYAHNQELPHEGGTPEGEAFLLIMGAAWRDCICAGVCESEDV